MAHQKSESFTFGFFICVRRTQHRLTVGQHRFEYGENIIVRLRTQMNDVALRANDVLRNDVGLRPMMLRFAQTERGFELAAIFSLLKYV